jgi:FAD:protein FMN transferase
MSQGIHRLTRVRPVMGCLAALECEAPDQASAVLALEAAFAALSQVDRLMHPTRAGSDLALLNTAVAGDRVDVHPWTGTLLRLCLKLSAISRGVFEPALPGCGSVRQLRLLSLRRVLIAKTVHLDLGGIAKGFAVDRAVASMKAAGAHAGLVNVGGDLRVFGRQVWPIALRLGARELQPLALRNAALAVSDPSAHARPSEHQGYHAPGPAVVLEPCGVAVQARSAALADGMTKVLMFTPAAVRAALLLQTRTRLLAIEN